MAAAAVSLACPLRRSSRLAHSRQHHRLKHRPTVRPAPIPDTDQDDSDDPDNELTPRALRALKRQRLALDPDGLPFAARPRPKKRRKDPPKVTRPHHPTLLSPHHPPISLPQSTDGTTATIIAHTASDPADQNRPPCPSPTAAKPELSIPLPIKSVEPSTSHLSNSPEPLTPLTPLTPSPESSPCLPGHDRQLLPLSPSHDPLPPPPSLHSLPMSDPTPSPSGPLHQQPSSTDAFPPPPLPTPPMSLHPTLDTLIPFEGLHPPFDSGLPVQIPPCQPSPPPQLQGLELQEQFHSFPPPQLYVPPNPVFVRDREINIWKLACQERVDYLLRHYGIDYIKALVESEARSVSQETPSSPSSGTTTSPEFCPATPSQTKFRLYTPASYTYSSTSWGSASATRKAFSVDDEVEDADPAWPMDDSDWIDADVDMEDEDEDDYEDDDEVGEAEPDHEGEATLEAVQGLVIADGPNRSASRVDTQPLAMQVDGVPGKSEMMQVDGARPDTRLATKATLTSEPPIPPRSALSTANLPPRPLRPMPHQYPSSPSVTPPSLPPLSSLHVPLLSEPPRAFMGRGTPPDRRRLIEWSGSGRLATNGMGPPLYLSPVPQRHTSADVGIVPMSVDAPMHPPSPHPHHTHGEWTSFLYSMLEGDGVGVGTSVGSASHASEQTWYELGLGSVPTIVPQNAPQLPLSHTHERTPAVEQSIEEGNNSSSTLRFALG